jgi:uncharacterized protein with PQ loop repeat
MFKLEILVIQEGIRLCILHTGFLRLHVKLLMSDTHPLCIFHFIRVLYAGLIIFDFLHFS